MSIPIPGGSAGARELTVAQAPQRRASFARNSLHLLVGQIAITVLSVTLNAALGRHFEAAEFGYYFVLMNISAFAYIAVDWGQSAELIREVARRPTDAGMLLGSSLLLRGANALLAVLVCMLVVRMLGYDVRTQLLAGLTIVCAFPLALSQSFGYLFRERDRMDLDAIVSIAAKVILVVVALPLLAMGGRLEQIILVHGLAGLGALWCAFRLARRIQMPLRRPSRVAVINLASGGIPAAVFYIAISLQSVTDAVLISQLAPADTVGWYGAARTIIGVLLAPAVIMATANLPDLTRAAHDTSELRRLTRRALRPVLGLGVLGALGTYLFADLAVSTLYGQGRFEPAARVLQMFAPSLLLFFVSIQLGSLALAVGRSWQLASVKIVCVFISSALAVALVPYFQSQFENGGLGLVLAVGSTEIIMIVTCVLLAPEGTLGVDVALDLFKALAAGAGTLVFAFCLPAMSDWIRLPIVVAAFALLSLIMRLWRWSEFYSRLPRPFRFL